MDEQRSADLTQVVQASNAISILPDAVQTGFWRAMGRLVGGALATPAAWLRRPAQAVEDKTDATSLVTRRIAEAVAEKAAADPNIVERAMESLVREEFRKQSNKEHIARTTAEAISGHTDQAHSDDGSVDEDWMNVFVRYAEDASSERMQKLWGRVLAGEIRNPGKYSLATIRFLSEIDTQIARNFERIVPLLFGDDLFKGEERNSGVEFALILELESAGLLSTGSFLQRILTLNPEGVGYIAGTNHGLMIKGLPGAKIQFPIAPLTRLGREVATLTPRGDETNEIEKISKYIQEHHRGEIETITLSQLLKLSEGQRLVPMRELFKKAADP